MAVRTRSSAAFHSIRVRLPLLILFLLAGAIALFLQQTYREVETTLLAAGRDRALRAAEQLSGLLERSVRQGGDNWRKAAADPDLRHCLAGDSCDAAQQRLSGLPSSGPRRLEVWNPAGVRVLEIVVHPTGQRAAADVVVPPGPAPTGPGIGPITAAGNSLFYDLAVAISDDPSGGRPLGYLVTRAPLTINPPDALTRLAGPDAAVALGNAAGGVWTDITNIIPAPSPEILRNTASQFRTPAGEARLGAVSAIRGTPWAVWVHYPRAVVLAPARAFQRRMGAAALALVLAGALLALLLSTRITSPIRDLAGAADQIASGDYTRRVTGSRRDEIGQLGRAFNDMAESVNDARRQLEVQILERSSSEAHYRAIVETAFDCIVSMDAAGRITEFNPAAERTFGYSKAEVIGKTVADTLVPPDLRDAHRAGLARYLATGQTLIVGKLIELPGMGADGTEFPLELAISVVRSDDAPKFTCVMRNISERKRAEEARLRSQAIEEEHRRIVEANRLKNEFLANMSHELRTPLNAINGFAELMHAGRIGPVSAEQKEYLGDILASGRHLLQLINDILDLAKVEAGKMDFHPVPVNLTGLVMEVRDIVRPLAAEKRLTMTVDIDRELTTVVVDPARVRQVLYNYVSNAIKFTPEGGTVGIRATLAGPGMFRIDVTDSGIGIAAEDIGKLFMQFQQLNSSTAKEHAGTGLGLALAKKLTEAHGGAVAVRSAPGEGSTFTATFPRGPRSASADADVR